MVAAPSKTDVQKLLADKNRGVLLDLGCGQSKMDGFIGIDIVPFKEVDIVWDLEKFPYPLPDSCASLIMCSHFAEHVSPSRVDPRLVGLVDLLKNKNLITKEEVTQYLGEYDIPSNIFIRFMDEMWRLLKPEGQLMIVSPYGGSLGYWQDPTHINGFNEVTFSYFDPLEPNSQGELYKTYRPKPWKIEYSTWHQSGNIEVCLQKRKEDVSYGGTKNHFTGEVKK